MWSRCGEFVLWPDWGGGPEQPGCSNTPPHPPRCLSRAPAPPTPPPAARGARRGARAAGLWRRPRGCRRAEGAAPRPERGRGGRCPGRGGRPGPPGGRGPLGAAWAAGAAGEAAPFPGRLTAGVPPWAPAAPSACPGEQGSERASGSGPPSRCRPAEAALRTPPAAGRPAALPPERAKPPGRGRAAFPAGEPRRQRRGEPAVSPLRRRGAGGSRRNGGRAVTSGRPPAGNGSAGCGLAGVIQRVWSKHVANV